ncbi:hypothetical protein F4804DRAFT_339630 [Jackrogersella minutella]|nr:hypothetical protein F4804DRAFT_339630 [Jackrogersella minutella]
MTGVGGTGPRITMMDLSAQDSYYQMDTAHPLWYQQEWYQIDDVVVLGNFTKQPTLKPINFTTVGLSNEPVFKISNEKPTLRWHKDTPKDDETIYASLKNYETDIPELFDMAKRRTNSLMKTVHYIDTGDSPPMKIPPRRYSPSQEQALRTFVNKHNSKTLRKSSSPWASPSLLTPKEAPGQTVMPNKYDENVQGTGGTHFLT